MSQPNVLFGNYTPTVLSAQDSGAEVIDAYFAIKKIEKENKIHFVPITTADLGDDVYVVVKTRGLRGVTMKVFVRQGKERLLTRQDDPLKLVQGKEDKLFFTASVGEMADSKSCQNYYSYRDVAITKVITLRHKEDDRTRIWNKLIMEKTDRKTFLYVSVEADTKKPVKYHGKKKEGEEGSERRFGNRDGKWLVLKPNYIAPWMMFAKTYLGLKGDPSSKTNPIIMKWINAHNFDFRLFDADCPITSDNESWDGIFVYTMLRKADVILEKGRALDYPSNASFYKNNWKNSYAIDKPQYGAIVKMNWSRVGFVLKFDESYVWVLGGIQDEGNTPSGYEMSVKIVKFKRKQVQEYRMPYGY